MSERDGYFTLDKAYFKKEAREGLRTFFMPFILFWRLVKWIKR